MKKFLAAILASAMLFSLAACGGTPAQPSASPSRSAGAAAAKAAKV